MPTLTPRDTRTDGPFITGSNGLFAAIVRDANDAIIGMDLHGTVLSWNDAAARLFGHRASDMIGRQVSRIIPYDRRREQETLLASVKSGARTGSIETLLMTTTGEEIAVTLTASPILDASNTVIAASLIIREHGLGKTGAPLPFGYPFVSSGVRGQAILVVEDEALIGLGLAAMLENAGFEVIGPVGDVTSATALLDRHDCALAILDINLRRGETSAPLAHRLKEEGIPFFVMSGYLADSQPAIFDEAPSFSKPVRARSLVAAVQEVLG